MEKGLGEAFRPRTETSPWPVKALFQIGTPLPLSHPLTSRTHSSGSFSTSGSYSSLETSLLNSPFNPLYSLPVLSPPPAYKYPSASAPFSLCFPSSSSPGRRGIARRSTANLQRSPIDSDLASEPRASSSPLSPPPLSGAPSDDFLLI
jgi:hypothetical protein